MRRIIVILFFLASVTGMAQKREQRLRAYYDQNQKVFRENLDFQNKFRRALDSSKEVKEEYEKALFYTRRAQNKFGASLASILGSLGSLIIAGVAYSNEDEDKGIQLSDVAITISITSLASSYGLFFSAIGSKYKANLHLRKAFTLAGVECPCEKRKPKFGRTSLLK
jgi:hypothetical protein